MPNLRQIPRDELYFAFNKNMEVVKAFQAMLSEYNSSPSTVKTTSATTNNTTTFANVAELKMPIEAGQVYFFESLLIFQTVATTTGFSPTATVPSGATINGFFEHPATAGTTTSGYVISSGTSSNSTSGVPVANTDFICRFNGIIINGSNAGDVQIQFKSEVAASQVTIQSYSTLTLDRL